MMVRTSWVLFARASVLFLVLVLHHTMTAGGAFAIRVEPVKPAKVKLSAAKSIASSLVFEVTPTKERKSALKDVIKRFRAVPGLIFGVYEEGINHFIVQSNAADSRELLELLPNSSAYRIVLLADNFVGGPFGFRFESGGYLFGLRCSAGTDAEDIAKSLGNSAMLVQAVNEKGRFLLWVPRSHCQHPCTDVIAARLANSSIEHSFDMSSEVGKRLNTSADKRQVGDDMR